MYRESLRLAEAVFARFPMSAPQEDLQYQDWTIPRGTFMSMSASATGLDPDVFPEPRAFRPGRWLQSPEVVEHLKKSFLPFGKGARQCIGME